MRAQNRQAERREEQIGSVLEMLPATISGEQRRTDPGAHRKPRSWPDGANRGVEISSTRNPHAGNSPAVKGMILENLSQAQLKREILTTHLLLAMTVIVFLLFMVENASMLARFFRWHTWWSVIEQIVFLIIMSFFVYGNLVYQVTRAGYLKRKMAHTPPERGNLDGIHSQHAPPLMILVPSYKEDTQVIRQTLMSAALQEYPNRRLVLLIDDPPNPSDTTSRQLLRSARYLPQKLQALFQEPAEFFQSELGSYLRRANSGQLDSVQELAHLARLYHYAADWIGHLAKREPIRNHTDAFFVEQILVQRLLSHRQRANTLKSLARDRAAEIDEACILQEFRRLANLFCVQIDSFERKKYVNLSHEPNKAMNLNSYIALIGHDWQEVVADDGGIRLQVSDGHSCNLKVPSAKYLITLDADSLLLPEYAIRLISLMEKPENSRLAVAQTPYSAVPNPGSLVERVAGATTDIQFITHQGFTHFAGTFWVGANALLRKSALDDISVEYQERGFTIKKFIQDRTVIEDTESSVDLIDKGWHLFNYPERLSTARRRLTSVPCLFREGAGLMVD